MAINGQALPSAVSFESPNVLVAYVWHAIACYVIALYIRCRTVEIKPVTAAHTGAGTVCGI
eukprot:scaffold143198_cov18-Tisochrysis_lutea.AAC.2